MIKVKMLEFPCIAATDQRTSALIEAGAATLLDVAHKAFSRDGIFDALRIHPIVNGMSGKLLVLIEVQYKPNE